MSQLSATLNVILGISSMPHLVVRQQPEQTNQMLLADKMKRY